MRYPSAAAYMDALQDPASCFSDPELAAGQPALTPLGLPRAMSGNVATVFRVDCPTGRSYAVRCFVRPFEDEAKRYTAIQGHLDGLRATWPVAFELQATGIAVGQASWPMLKMDWSSGESLTSYVERNLWDSAAMAYLAVRFAQLAGDLQAAQVAHGDLQHGNVLVVPGGDLRLIDYDGMYVPELAGFVGNERGHRNYQHPGRSLHDFGDHLDRFPSWVIYTSLVAVAADPLLWGRLDGGDECLLFRQEDLESPATSPVFAALAASSEPSVVRLGRMLRSFLGRDVAAVPPLSLAHAPKPPQAREGAESVDAGQLADRQSLYAALRGAAPAPAGGGQQRRAPVEATPFSGNLTLPRAALRGALGTVVLVVVLAAAGVVGPAAAVVVLMVLAGGAAAIGDRAYRALPEVVAARGTDAELASRRAAAASTRAAVDHLAARRAAVDQEEAAARERNTRLADDLRRRQADEVRVVEERLREALASLSAREQALLRAEREALDQALVALQRMAESAALLVPVKLPPAREREVRDHHAALRRDLAAEEVPVRAAAAEAAARAAARFEPEHARLRAEVKEVEAAAVSLRVDLDRELAQARKAAAEAQWRLDSWERDTAAHGQLTRGRFFRQLTWR